MSTSHDDVLWLRPYDEIDTRAPDCGFTALPGRIAALSHPLNKGREVLLPDREWYDPDLATVASSGVFGFEPGDVVVLAPDHGAYFPGLSTDGRECRMVGVVKPWWESVLAKFSREGLAPAPGWLLVERERVGGPASPFDDERSGKDLCRGPLTLPSPSRGEGDTHKTILTSVRPRYTKVARVVASCGDGWTSPHVGERVCTEGLRTYTLRCDGEHGSARNPSPLEGEGRVRGPERELPRDGGDASARDPSPLEGEGRVRGPERELPRDGGDVSARNPSPLEGEGSRTEWKDLALVRAPIASKKWLSSLARTK